MGGDGKEGGEGERTAGSRSESRRGRAHGDRTLTDGWRRKEGGGEPVLAQSRRLALALAPALALGARPTRPHAHAPSQSRIEMATERQMQTRCRIALAEPLSMAVPARPHAANNVHQTVPTVFLHPTSFRCPCALGITRLYLTLFNASLTLNYSEPTVTQTAIPAPPALGIVRSTLSPASPPG